jgi:pyridinium-3,5-biscarboxylic acid mononucleotide synthase
VTRDRVAALLRDVAAGSIDVDAALDSLAVAPAESLPFATIDHHRALRQGYPEVIFGEGKTVEQAVAIAERIAARGDGVLVTRADEAMREALAARFSGARVNAVARTVAIAGEHPVPQGVGTVLVITAGTGDLPVAEEASETAIAMGNTVSRVTDVGVAGIHRVLAQRDALLEARVVIVVAGMDGALPSVVGGLVRTPVIAVPTSVGYGGAAGVSVVNIDNGFGAAVAASRITHA